MLNRKKNGKYPPGRAVFVYLQQLSYLILCHTFISNFTLQTVLYTMLNIVLHYHIHDLLEIALCHWQ